MNTSFDFVTLYFCGAVTAVSATVAMLWVWRVHAREAAVRWWALGYLACAIATVMFALPQWVPVLLAKSLGNLVALASIVLIYVGTLRFLERPVAVRLLALVFVPAALANLYWSLVVDALVPRLLVFAAATTVACGLMSRALWSAAEGPQRAVYRFVGSCWALYGLATLARSLAFVMAGPELRMPNLGLPQALWFAVLQAMLILTAVGHLLMASQRLQLRLDELASLDALTGVFNRRAFLAAFNQRQRAPKRVASAVLVLDLDHFKQINDRHGHAAGDAVLRAVVARVQSGLRDRDVFARAGGEEFWLLLPGVDREVARTVAERLRAAVAVQAFEHEGLAIAATVSIGVALLDADGGDIHAALSAADRALYAAKSGGRDRVVLATD